MGQSQNGGTVNATGSKGDEDGGAGIGGGYYGANGGNITVKVHLSLRTVMGIKWDTSVWYNYY